MDGIVACALVRLTSNAEQRYTQAGKLMATFSAMVLDSKHQEGAEPEWLRCTCWGETAEALADSLKKGAECYVEGRLRLRSWTGKDGATRSGLELSAWRCDALGQIGRRRPPASQSRGWRGAAAATEAEEDGGELPF